MNDLCPCCLGDPNTVCDVCDEHACWAGRFMCEGARTAGVRQRRTREPRQVIDEIDRLLTAEKPVGLTLATELLVVMTPDDRARWLRLAVEHAWRPDIPWS